jgi:Ca2+-binding RTX toxin-like protein
MAFVTLALLGATATASAQAGPRPCTITGTAGDDVLNGTRAADVICGRGGDDRIRGRGGNDVLRGGPGRDALRGDGGRDRLAGGADGDILIDDDHDAIVSGPGDDVRPLGDRLMTGPVEFRGLKGVTVTLTQGQPTRCTRDERYETFEIGSDPVVYWLVATVKSSGSCWFDWSTNTWHAEFSDGSSGDLSMQTGMGIERPEMWCPEMWCGNRDWRGALQCRGTNQPLSANTSLRLIVGPEG